MPQAVAAVEVGVHEFKSDFVYPSAAQQDLAANVTHSNRDVYVCIGSDAERIFFKSGTAAQANFAYRERRPSPRAADGCRDRFLQHDAFVASLTHPGASGSGIERADGQLTRFKTALGHDLGRVARIDFRQ